MVPAILCSLTTAASDHTQLDIKEALAHGKGSDLGVGRTGKGRWKNRAKMRVGRLFVIGQYQWQ